MTTRRRTTTSHTRRSRTRRRSTTTTRRRTKPKLATTVGAAIGTLIVAILLDAPWPVRIGLVLLALVVGLGYLYVQGRRNDAANPAPQHGAPADAPPAGGIPTPEEENP